MASELSRRNFLKTAGLAGGLLAANHAAGGAEAADAPRAGGRKTPIIDSHVHLKHGDAKRTEFPPQVIVAIMDKAGIDKSVVFAMCTTTKRSIEMAELAATSYPDRLIPYAYALPSYERPVLKELEAALKDKLFKGIKVHAGECTLPEYIIDPVLKLAGRFEVPCLIDVVGNHAQARRMAKAFPDTILIYAHMGRYLTQDAKLVDSFIQVAEDYKNVLLDLSGVELVAKIGEAARRVGAGKLVWGTDGPYAHPELVLYAKNELDKVRKLDVRPEQKEEILGGNIVKLLKLKV
jgi:predicted TIM-barrel fold metal-dependent hydrolase